MPTINKPPKKTSSEKKQTDMRKLRQKAYQLPAWRKMRDTYMKEHPICEECLKVGKVTAAVDIHHKKSPFRNGEVNYGLLLDYDNLMSVCKECHAAIHNKQLGHISPEDVLKQLDALMNPEISDKDIENGNY